MGGEPPAQSSSDSDSNSDSESDNSDSYSYSSSNSDSESSTSHGSGSPSKGPDDQRKASPKAKSQQQFSVTSSETGLRLKIAAIPRVGKAAKKPSPKKKTPVPTVAARKGNYTPSDEKNRDLHKPPNQNKMKKDGNSKTKVKKKTLSESSSDGDDSFSVCSDSDSSGDDARKNSNKKSKNKRAAKHKSLASLGSRAGPKLSATVYSKVNNDSSDSDVPIKPRSAAKENVCDAKVNLKDESHITSAKDDRSAKPVHGGAVTRKKTAVTKKDKKTPINEKSKAPPKAVAKRPRGRPSTKLAVANATAAAVGEESSCSSQRSGSSHSCSSSDTESDTDSNALAAACSLQVINEEDLAAILPEHQPCAAFGDFSSCADGQAQPSDTKVIQENGDGSSSEMELPPQLVNAAIQRATADSSSSENESTSQDMTHSSATHYASTLLQQFVAQTQLLSHTNTLSSIATGIPPLNPTLTAASCSIPNAINKVGLNDCVLNQTCPVTDMAPSFLSTDHLSSNNTQHLSNQQTEELSNINDNFPEIASVANRIENSVPNSCLGDCVDSNNFINHGVGKINSNLESCGCSTNNAASSSKSSFSKNLKSESVNSASNKNQEKENKTLDVKRKRGRPRKIREEVPEQKLSSSCDNLSDVNNIVVNEFCRKNDPPNVSPDSGILSNHNSPSHSPHRAESVENVLKLPNSKSTIKNNIAKRSSRSKSKSSLQINNRDRSLSSEASCKRKTFSDYSDRKNSKMENQVPKESVKIERKKTEKLDIAALDRMLYATDRVLYPPRRKVGRPPQNKNFTKKGPGRPPKNKTILDSEDSEEDIRLSKGLLSEVYAKRKDINKLVNSISKKTSKNLTNWRDIQSDNETVVEDSLDPMWREIDLNPKYRGIISGYKSDHETKSFKICSRLLESGYKSDYGCKSGYKSDHCCKSGYKSDHKSGYKSDKSGYKSDYSIRSIRRRMKKLKKSRSVRDRSYYKNQKYFVSDQEILLLANKTFSCLTLGHSTSDSDSESRSQNSHLPSKFTSTRGNGAFSSKFTFGSVTNRFNQTGLSMLGNMDLFAPAPVFSGLSSRSNILNYNIFNQSNRLGFNKTCKTNFGSLYPTSLSAFTHKFACPPITTTRSEAFSLSVPSLPNFNRDISNNNTMKQSTRNLSPKNKKNLKSPENIYPIFKKEKSPPPVTNIFQQTESAYIPNKSLSRNIFLNVKKPQKKNTISQWKKHKTQLILTPAKSQNIKNSGRLSRMSNRNTESRHHRHKSKKHKRQRRSRSISRNREICTKSVAGTLDQKFSQEMESLIGQFVKLCHNIPKVTSQQTLKSSNDKVVPENIVKCTKRTSKKRKGPDNTEMPTPTSKRRHKKQLQESQNKGGKDKDTSTNEHKLPLKKRHYHINSSTNNSLSLSLVATEFVENLKTENAKGSDSFVCTETNCLVDLKDDNSKDKTPNNTKSSGKVTNINEKTKKENSIKNQDNTLQEDINKNNTTISNNDVSINVHESQDVCTSLNISQTVACEEPQSKKSLGEHSELSKKIFETSEKLKAVHKMVNDFEKSLPRSKDTDSNNRDLKSENNKNSNTSPILTSSCSNNSSNKNSPPIVTPKKRHRLEADKLANTESNLVIHSFTKKILEEKNNDSDSKISAKLLDSLNTKNNHIHDQKYCLSNDDDDEDDDDDDNNADNTATDSADVVKSSSKSSKNSSPTSQKTEIITRKKNRLEGLTSSLVSKIIPSSGFKNMDMLTNCNLRKSIESRIIERNKSSTDTIDKSSENYKCVRDSAMNCRATVIKSPISKLKLPAEAKKLPKGTDILIEEMVVVNVEKPTGIFEPSVDIELQIPKSSISINQIAIESSSKFGKSMARNIDNKINGKITKLHLEGENQIPSHSPNYLVTESKIRKLDSIASVISERIIENGHNLRHSKRNQYNENYSKSTDDIAQNNIDKKKKKFGSNILKESKLKILPKLSLPQLSIEQPKISLDKTETENQSLKLKNVENVPITLNADTSVPLKKRAKRRKAINRTGFPSAKKKKKKNNFVRCINDENLSDSNSISHSDNNLKPNSAFERVPKSGEATNSFLERTTRKKQSELKVLLNKEDCPKQGRVSVIAIERLQGKSVESIQNSKTLNLLELDHFQTDNIETGSSSEKGESLLNEQPVMDTVTKWEILSETDSIPPLSASLNSNDPEDSIPLSLLNLKAERPNSRIDIKNDKLKRKIRDISPAESLDNIVLSKRAVIDKRRSKSSLSISESASRRSMRSTENYGNADSDDTLLSTIKNKPKHSEKSSNYKDTTREVRKISHRRKSRSSNTMKRLREMTSSSRDSSLETVKTIKRSPKSRDNSVETLKNLQESCSENEPLPLQEKEVDFEKSIDVLSKSIISKKRIMSSRDDSPASSIDRGYRSEKEKGFNNKRNPRTRKKYLVAGLFSSYYKESDPKPIDHKAKLIYNASDYPNGLMSPPPYCERWVRQRKQHFMLPYDIWWQHQYNKPVPSWNYRKIRTNVYFDVKPTPDGCESQACNCRPSSECQDDCINRLVYAECSPQLCPCKELCRNQRIQKHEWAPGLDKFMTENKGWGIRTKLPINNGNFILEYVGEVVSDKEFKDRMATRYTKDTHHYCLHLDGGLVIDGHRMGGEGRFVNHSCQPNCEMQKWSVNGLFRMALFALRDIKPGEELTYDYNFSLFNPAEGQPCKCDSDNCRGVIGGKSQRIAKQIPKSQLKTHISSTPIISNPILSLQNPNSSVNTPNRVGRPRKAVKATIKSSCHPNTFLPERSDSALFLKEVQSINLTSRFWQEPQMKPLTAKEKIMVKDRHCFLHRNLDKVRRVRERLLTHPVLATGQIITCVQPNAFQVLPNNVINIATNGTPVALQSTIQNATNPSVFLTRLHALRAPRNIKTRRLAQAEDNVELSKHARLANVFRELYNCLVTARDDKNNTICTPILRKKIVNNADLTQSPLDLSTIEANIETGFYKNVALFDSQLNTFFAGITKTFGRTSNQGVVALQLKKIYTNAKLDFAEQLTNILGPEESLPQGFLQKRKQEEVIMCVCGLHGEEGLMVQCGGEGDQQNSNNSSNSLESAQKWSEIESTTSNDQKNGLKSSINGEPVEHIDLYNLNNAKLLKGCGVWQHARCMQVTDVGEPYYCHRCQPREVNLEIPLDEYTDDGNQFYLSLLRGDLQVRQGDTVYVLRDIPIDEKHPDCSDKSDNSVYNGVSDVRDSSIICSKAKRLDRSKKSKILDKDKANKEKNKKNEEIEFASKDATNNNKKESVHKHTYKTIGAISVTELDIFRVERLWRDRNTGQRYVYGHHYLRPHETYHEPTRKFFPNEVMRVPLYEAVPIELVMSQCWVMDLNTYCKGRPLAAKEEHVYICELRVDKCARLFTKISKPKYPVCTKSYAFEMFPQRLKITRTYAPHEVSPSLLKNRSRKGQDGNTATRETKSNTQKTTNIIHPALPVPKPKGAPLLHTTIVKNRATQKARLNGILLKLLSKMPTKQPLDMSYLLDGRRQRKKMISS